MSHAYQIILTVAVTLLCGCTQSGEKVVPLPPAYPRIEVYPPEYTPYGEMAFEANAKAVAELEPRPDSNEWLTLTYPQFGATIHLSYHPGLTPEKQREMWLNRQQRMSLNSGGLPSEAVTLTTPAGWKAELMITPQGSPTPVQFVASGMRHGNPAILTGGATLSITPVSADSIAPVVKMLERDIIHALNSLPYD